MAGVTFLGVNGVNEVIATFTAKTEGMDSATALIVRKAAFDVERGAKIRAPFDTGFLRNSIVTEIQVNTGRVYGAEVRAEAEYAVYQEYGTSRQPPQPFMGPALDAVAPGFIAALEAIADPLRPR